MEDYCKEILKLAVAQICQTVGWHKIHSSSLEVLTDILSRYLKHMCVTTHNYSEHYGMTEPNLYHVGMTLRDLNVSIHDFEEYINWVEPMPLNVNVPRLPVPKESHLNFLKPGSREVVTRPVHVHEHLPPMYPEMETQGQSPIHVVESPSDNHHTSPPILNETLKVSSSPEAISEVEVFKRPSEPVSTGVDNSKRAKLSFGEEGRPTREISSVMMTSSGYLSPAREGKLPEARTPQTLTESQATSSSQYPAVPPELRVDKKVRKIEFDTLKRKDGTTVKLDPNTKIKKLVGMKENAKLKPFKSMAQNTDAITSGKNFHNNLAAMQRQIPSETRIQKVPLVTKPIPIEDPPIPTVVSTPVLEPGVTIIEIDDRGVRKLSNEPDKIKLNIFKKISSKSKDEKNDKSEKGDRKSDNHFDIVSAVSTREFDIIPINPEPVTGTKPKVEKSRTPEITIKEERLYPVMTVQREPTRPPTPTIKHTFYDMDLSPPATPKTPEPPAQHSVTIRKIEKDKKKRKDKMKKIKAHKIKHEMMSPKRPKVEVNLEPPPVVYDPPKTPEDPKVERVERVERQEITPPPLPPPTVAPPIFPLFPSIPSGPGLIPKVNPKNMYPPFFPRGINKHGFGQPPLMPINTLIAPSPASSCSITKSEPPPSNNNNNNNTTPKLLSPKLTSPTTSTSSTKTTPLTPSPGGDLDVVNITPVKVEKKSKEHKKEKKDKLEKKIRKKKDKKDKKKGKEKGEKKLEKEEKKEKIKLKKEKKEKHKDKQLPSETSVPKLTLKLGPQQRESTPDGIQRKITIKQVAKKSVEETVLPTVSEHREASPELARISALVTRPPKTPKSSMKGQQHDEKETGAVVSPTSGVTLPTPVRTHAGPGRPRGSTNAAKAAAAAAAAAAVAAVAAVAAQNNTSNSGASGVPPPATVGKPVASSQAMAPKAASVQIAASQLDKDGNKVWICPACGRQDDGSPMIGCDDCDAWYHWVCVGIQVPPDDNEDWYCKVCIGKKQESLHTDKKKKRKKREKKEH